MASHLHPTQKSITTSSGPILMSMANWFPSSMTEKCCKAVDRLKSSSYAQPGSQHLCSQAPWQMLVQFISSLPACWILKQQLLSHCITQGLSRKGHVLCVVSGISICIAVIRSSPHTKILQTWHEEPDTGSFSLCESQSNISLTGDIWHWSSR